MSLSDTLTAFLKRENHLKLDNYRWALILGLPIALAILIPLLALGVITGVYLIPDWLIGLFFIPSFLGNFISGSTYIGRLIDSITALLSKKSKNDEEKIPPITLISAIARKVTNLGHFSKWELFFTGLGFLLGIGITAALIATGFGVPLIEHLPSVLAYSLFALGNVAAFAGLGNRFGVSTSGDSKLRLTPERKAILIAILIGIALGIILAITGGMGAIPVAGITAFFIGAKFTALTGTLFTLSLASTLASATDYFVRAFYYLRYLIGTTDQKTNELITGPNSKLHEYRGAFIGVSAGLVLGAVAVATLMLTQPHLFIGVLGVVALVMVVVAATSMLGGLCSRIGRYLDGFKNQANSGTASNKSTPDDAPQLSLALKGLGGMTPQPLPEPTPTVVYSSPFVRTPPHPLPRSDLSQGGRGRTLSL